MITARNNFHTSGCTIADDITTSGGKAVFKSTDVRRRGDLEELVALAVEHGGQLDVIINCAGIGVGSG